MANSGKKWDLLSDETRKRSIQETIDFFKIERDEEIGIIAAGNILDHFLESVAYEIYNSGVEDSLRLLKERFESLELDMESLHK